MQKVYVIMNWIVQSANASMKMIQVKVALEKITTLIQATVQKRTKTQIQEEEIVYIWSCRLLFCFLWYAQLCKNIRQEYYCE